ncbi:MAG: PilZ domain-containing protein [Elusimicrobia bacterium]|nr:PilZ domain-containing protein [Elusimicrobiota bacterium]
MPLAEPPAKGLLSLLTLPAGPFEERLQVAWSRFSVLVSSMSIRYKIAGALVAVLCLAIVALGAATFSQQKRLLEEEMRRRAEALVRQIAATGKNGLLANDELETYSVLKDIQLHSGALYALVLDRRGRVFAHSVLTEKGKVLAGPLDRATIETRALLFQRDDRGREPILDASLPIVTRFGGRELRVGTARVGLSEKSLRDAIRRQKLAFIAITAAFIALGLLISSALGRILTRRILILAMGMKVAARGNLTQQVKIEAMDEIGHLAQVFNDMVLKLQDKLHMERYLSPSTLRLIRQSREDPKLGGERRYVTMLFSDVRGFTATAETLDPEEVVSLLNIYLNLQAEVIYRLGGTVDKFVGDEVMAIFTDHGAELPAASAALEIQRVLGDLNAARAAAGKRRMEVGIGLNSGEAVMGNMGSERQMDYTVIGDVINTAARLCSAAAPGQVILGPATASALAGRCLARPLGPLALKGKREPMPVWELLELSRPVRAYLRRQVRLRARYRPAGTSADWRHALVRDIGAGGCVLEVPFPSEPGSPLELDVALPAVPELRGVRASVLHARKDGHHHYLGVRFEELDAGARRRITEFAHQV